MYYLRIRIRMSSKQKIETKTHTQEIKVAPDYRDTATN